MVKHISNPIEWEGSGGALHPVAWPDVCPCTARALRRQSAEPVLQHHAETLRVCVVHAWS